MSIVDCETFGVKCSEYFFEPSPNELAALLIGSINLTNLVPRAHVPLGHQVGSGYEIEILQELNLKGIGIFTSNITYCYYTK